ncbi:RNA polymerase sigma factor (sigma-70 family) [Bacillus sp. SORGH_AS 510]|uniref:sigma-70 family RNA polymerase sigma factor n=1 Tax=Bacillus sp. SORGH_AS_0510 TaxID=3041771 RepID=UPI002784F622|nr:sigma-70 family RNA polymerase sigma factor [Bacillus sp. SORGH_AS_0510]MDQ1143918.1 RNA polymerase sigma factor (sigma-70 family) [Bacillus sp. SORGH_AS_0510]
MLADDFEGRHFSSKDTILIYLMNEYGTMVKRLAFSYVKDTSLAEDIAQEVFIAAYKNLDAFKGESSYKTWIYRIAINRSKDMVKSKAFQMVSLSTIINPFKKSSTSTEVEVIRRENSNKVLECILSLPIKYREIIYLFYYEELKIHEIHQITQINTETIKSRLRRGKQLLKNKLSAEDLQI